MIIVTGGAGFIGSNIVHHLNARGYQEIIVVDDLTDGKKFQNLTHAAIADYLDKDAFLEATRNRASWLTKITAIFHEGACSDTTEWNGKYIMANNYDYSKVLLHYALEKRIPFLYASSAAVYGDNTQFSIDLHNEKPINMYAYSKWQFDQYVRRILPHANSQIVGLRYFNVYGPREQHKGNMASVAFHFNNQIKATGVCRLFEGTDGYGHGEQLRDFVFIDDICRVNLWFFDHASISGIYNVGTGKAQSFNDVAHAVIAWHNQGSLEYIPFPEKLQGCYQSYTQADITGLRQAGYEHHFASVEQGVKRYLDWLHR